MAQNIYGNICTVQQEMHKIHQQGSFPAEVYNFGKVPSDQEMIVRCDLEEQAGRQTPQKGGQRTPQCCLYILVTICVVLLIAGVCAGTFVYFQISAEVQDVKAEVSAFKAQGTQNSDAILKLENLLRSQVEMINSQEEKNKEDLLQNIQSVEENITARIAEQIKNLRQFGSEENSSWKRFGSKLYYFSQTSNTWEKAREQCVAMGATLAMVKTDEQMAFLANEGTPKHWLGLSDISTEGTWKWLDGSIPDKQLWAPGEPNNEGEEDCGEINGRLNDLQCDRLRPWVCEKSIAI